MNTSTLRIWDLPTRLFHWGLALSLAGSIISIKTGHTDWHFRFGYLILTLLLFRLIWGFAGPRYARFSSFPPSLTAAWAYVRGRAANTPGHSPLAAWSVYALLASCVFQAVSGLFSNDGIIWDGPLRKWISGSASDTITALHLANRFVLIALIALHLLAIAWYRFIRGKRLVRPMISGDSAEAPADAEPAQDDLAVRLRALAIFLASGAAVGWLIR